MSTIYIVLALIMLFNVIGFLYLWRICAQLVAHIERIHYWIGIHAPLINPMAVRVPDGGLRSGKEEVNHVAGN